MEAPSEVEASGSVEEAPLAPLEVPLEVVEAEAVATVSAVEKVP